VLTFSSLFSCDSQSGITTLHRDPTSGMLSVMQQFRIDQRAGIKDLDGMIGANSVAARYIYIYIYIHTYIHDYI
jgi:hypothetical protein